MAAPNPNEALYLDIVEVLCKDGEVMKKWRSIANRLGLSDADIEALRYNFNRDVDYRRLMESLMELYISAKGGKPLSEFLAILNRLECIYVKEILETKYPNDGVMIVKVESVQAAVGTKVNLKTNNTNMIDGGLLPPTSASLKLQTASSAESHALDEDVVDFVDNMTPLTVVVRKPPTKTTRAVGENGYELTSEPSGYALIINNIEFERGIDNRDGAEKDASYMKELFKQLKYVCSYTENVESTDLEGVIDAFKKRFKKVTKVDSCVVVIMSHGGRDQICMSDGVDVNLWDEIVYKFDNINFPEMKGKPKIFITQTCQNFRSVTDATTGPSISDTIVCFPAIPGQPANRDFYLGTWYIYCLTQIFMDNAYKMELQDMLYEVQKKMLNIKSIKNKDQISNWTPIIFKKFYFNL